jgi:hypothetical protein
MHDSLSLFEFTGPIQTLRNLDEIATPLQVSDIQCTSIAVHGVYCLL